MNTAKKSLTVYYRDGCHLCIEMMTALQFLQSDIDFDIDFDIEPVNIDLAEPDLRQRYHVDIPVVLLDEEVLCYHFYDDLAVRQALTA